MASFILKENHFLLDVEILEHKSAAHEQRKKWLF